MKLLRYGESGHERPGVLDSEGRIRDLSGMFRDLGGETLNPAQLSLLKGMDLSSLPGVKDGSRLGPCVFGTRHFIGVGLNYADHAAETGMPIPREPILFNKAVSSISGPNDPILLPPGAAKVDWEIELALVIGQRAWQVSEGTALEYLAGFCICNDLSERSWQLEGSGQWLKGKSAPSFGPIGPWLVTPDEIPDPMALSLVLEVNGEVMQFGSTATMIFGPAFLIAYISRYMILEPGDVITTGTPPGVGMGRNRYLASGDHLHLAITSLGEQAYDVL